MSSSDHSSDADVSQGDSLVPRGWPMCHPNYVVMQLRKLQPEQCPEQRAFDSSYPEWDKMTALQQNKTQAFFISLPECVKKAVESSALSESAASITEASARDEDTNDHDRCRLMHLYVLPSAQALWIRAYQPMNRRKVATQPDPWQQLAAQFNDESLVFQNQTIVYDEHGNRKVPYQPIPQLESIAKKCFELNPSTPGRPKRDGGWIRKSMREIRINLTKIFQNFSRSGNQEAENLYDEWCKFCTSYSDVYYYAYCIMDRSQMDQLGIALPRHMQRDSGALPTDGKPQVPRKRKLSPTPGAIARKNQRARRAAMRSGGSDSSEGMSLALESILSRTERIRAVEFMALNSTDENIKQRAHDYLLQLSGLCTPSVRKALNNDIDSER